jgi:hypothetical protein
MIQKFVKAVFAGSKRRRIYISRRPTKMGGGSNTFTNLFTQYAKKHNYKIVKKLKNSDIGIIIANLGDEKEIEKAKERGCYIIHRLDEYFEKCESGHLIKDKHKKILRLNKFADITVFQSQFVFENVYPILKPENYKVIYNGGDPDVFRAGDQKREYIGHVSWGVGAKKRLDLLHKFIVENPQEKFLLVGRHRESDFNFNLPNVTLAGKITRDKLPHYFQKMKFLYFPSERDPCPNTVIESILSVVPVCYNAIGGSIELTKDCGEPLERVNQLRDNLESYRKNCLSRSDLNFENVFNQYICNE